MTTPMISAIMPTRDRRAFVPHAITLFLRQSYPNKELLVLDNGLDPIRTCIPDNPSIRYIRISGARLPIGMLRNLACSLARGEYICHFDDDDYHGPQRLSQQIAPLLSGEAEFSAMRMSRLLDISTGTLWTCDDATHRQCFKQDVHYGTLMYPVSYWQSGLCFPPVQVGEDVRFVHSMLSRGARLARIVDADSFAYVLHGTNTTSDMRLAHPDGWEEVSLRDYFSERERAFYAGFRKRG